MKPPFRRGQHLSSLDLLSCALQIIPYIKYFCIIVTVKYFFPGRASRCQCRLMGSHGCRPRAQWVLSDWGSLSVLPLPSRVHAFLWLSCCKISSFVLSSLYGASFSSSYLCREAIAFRLRHCPLLPWPSFWKYVDQRPTINSGTKRKILRNFLLILLFNFQAPNKKIGYGTLTHMKEKTCVVLSWTFVMPEHFL